MRLLTLPHSFSFCRKQVLLFCLGIGLVITTYAQQVSNFAWDARLLKNTLLEKHVQPLKIDDQYSRWVFDRVIEGLDVDRIYFSQEDLKVLTPFREKIDDELNGGTWMFLPQLTQLYKNCLNRYQKGINDLAVKPTDFNSPEYLHNDTTFAVIPSELSKRWRQIFLFNTLDRLVSLQSKVAEKTEKEFLSQYEPLARQQVQKVLIRDAERVLHDPAGFEAAVASQFFNVMAAAFDPHTTYFSAPQVQNFVTSLSMQGYFFGITLRENERGEISIAQIMPGGPAWKSGEIHIGDVLQTLRWEGQEVVDLWSAELDEVNDMLGETNHAALEMTLRKTDGTVKTVSMKKEKIESEEGAVKSFVLSGKNKIGYISLPAFYTDWGAEDGSKCANDVAREILKLKQEGIEGLILDVRFNGGGSLMEAVAMTGIFIDAGPVVVVKNRAGELLSIKDMNRGTIYDGPMVLMVNGMSASASEILAGALQDYHRALIVGGNTYGKATAQQLFPLTLKGPVPVKQKGPVNPTMQDNVSYASITMERLYRVTGKTAQRIGVVPDISIPDALQGLPVRENSLERSFPSDSIQKKTYYQALAPFPLKDLRDKSVERVGKQPGFKAMVDYGSQLLELQQSEKLSLAWDKFKKDALPETPTMSVEKSSESEHSFRASKMRDEEQRMRMDSYINEFNKAWIKNLEADIFLNESFSIICDLIPYRKK